MSNVLEEGFGSNYQRGQYGPIREQTTERQKRREQRKVIKEKMAEKYDQEFQEGAHVLRITEAEALSRQIC